MFYALAFREDLFRDHVSKNILLGPCFVPELNPVCTDIGCLNTTVFTWTAIGLYAYNGPNWETQGIYTACGLSSDDQCAYYHSITGKAPVSVYSDMYWNQMAYQKRFQTYAHLWEVDYRKEELIPIERIQTIPMSVFTAKNDTYCKYDVAMEHLKQIPAKKTLIDVDNEGHDYFDSKLNNDWFM